MLHALRFFLRERRFLYFSSFITSFRNLPLEPDPHHVCHHRQHSVLVVGVSEKMTFLIVLFLKEYKIMFYSVILNFPVKRRYISPKSHVFNRSTQSYFFIHATSTSFFPHLGLTLSPASDSSSLRLSSPFSSTLFSWLSYTVEYRQMPSRKPYSRRDLNSENRDSRLNMDTEGASLATV